MMGNFDYPALFGTGDISFNIKLTTKAMLCGESLYKWCPIVVSLKGNVVRKCFV
jgi:hypothetical protein